MASTRTKRAPSPAAAGTQAKARSLQSLTKALDAAFVFSRSAPPRVTRSFAGGVHAAVDVIDAVLAQGQAASAVLLAEHALAKLEAVLLSLDDSSGYLGEVRARLLALHRRACMAARPDPVELARRLFARELASDFDLFHVAAETYADVLGPQGLAEYRRLAEERWSTIRPLRPGEDDPDRWGTRFRITSIMLAIARAEDDVEAQAEVLERDLSTGYGFLQIAELHRDHGNPELALAWVEKGLEAFPEHTDWRLRAFAADAYLRAGRDDDAMALVWAELSERPDFERYKLLKEYADRAEAWPRWRAKALAFLRERLAVRKRESASSGWHGSDHSTLVAIHLWEGDPETAWKEAEAGGCSSTLWMALARERETRHPEDAVPVYQREVEALVRQGNNDAYAQAVALLKMIRNVMTRIGPDSAFTHYLDEVRHAHKAKRNFLRMIDAVDWKRVDP